MINLKKSIHQWSWIMIILFCVVGLFYPVLGLTAVICMLAPVAVAFFKGRTWCGNFCPRGSFNDVILKKVSFEHKIPKIFTDVRFRIFFLVLLMSAFAVQLVMSWGDLAAVGGVFVRMILLTTLLTVMLGMTFKPRTWCTFCPMGTMAYFVSSVQGFKKGHQTVRFHKDQCINCNLCTKNCPISINVLSYKEEGAVTNADCLKCGICVEKCPKKALSLE